MSLLRKDRMGIPTSTSDIWAGYADAKSSTGGFAEVESSWNVPEIVGDACTKPTFPGVEQSAFWIGLDGYGGPTVEQTGTISGCDQGSPFYYAWLEMYPSPMQPLFAVSPGDHMTAWIGGGGNSNGVYSMVIDDTTSGSKWSGQQDCPSGYTCPGATAEVIAESPGGCQLSTDQACRTTNEGSAYPMANFGWVKFHNIGVFPQHGTGTSWDSIGSSQFDPVELTMTDRTPRTIVQVTSPLSSNEFTATWEHAA